MLTSYSIGLEGRADPVLITTDQRDLFALRRRGWKDLEYESPEKAMEVFNQASTGKDLDDAALTAIGLEALTTVTWLLWHAAVRNELTASDFDTFAEKELISMDPVVDTTNGNGAAGNGTAVRPTKRTTSAGGSTGLPR